MSLFIGIDSGTQSVKAVVLDLDTRIVIAEARAPHTLIAGKPVTLNGIVNDGFSRLPHFGTSVIFGASPVWEAETRISRSAIAFVSSRHSNRLRRTA